MEDKSQCALVDWRTSFDISLQLGNEEPVVVESGWKTP